VTNPLIAAVEARACKLLGEKDERAASAICYVLWLMQVDPPYNSEYFMLRVKGCPQARLADRAFDKAVGDLVTYAIHFKERS
jgi:hypothetical protein